jgi:hypothetical protein
MRGGALSTDECNGELLVHNVALLRRQSGVVEPIRAEEDGAPLAGVEFVEESWYDKLAALRDAVGSPADDFKP